MRRRNPFSRPSTSTLPAGVHLPCAMLHPSRVPLLVLLLFAIPGGADFSRFSHENSPIRAQLRRSIVAPPFSTVYSYHPAPSYGAQAPLYLDNTNDFYRNVAAGASPNPYRPPNPAPRYPSPFYSPPAQRPETFYPQQRGYQSPPPVQDDRQVPGVAYYSPSRNSAKKPPVLLISNYAADNFRGGATIQEYQPTASAPLPPRDVFRHPQYPSAYEQYQSVQRPPPAEQAYSFPAPAYQSFQSPDTRPPPTFRNGADLTDYAPSKAPTPPPTSRTSTSASPPGRPELIYSPSHVPPEEANPSMVPPVVYSPPPQGQQLNPPSHVPPTYETPGREGLSRPQPAPPHTNVFNPVEFVPHKEYLELGYRQPPENYFESGYPAAPRQENPYTLPPGQPRYSPAETPYTSRPPYTEEVSPRPTPPRIVSETPGTIVYPSERTFPTAPTPRYPEVPSAPPSYPYEETTPFVTISPHPTSRPPPVGELTGPPSETVFTFSPPTGSSTTVTPRTEGFVPPFFSTSPTPPTRFPTPPFVPPETPRTPMFPERTPGIPTPMVPSTPRFPETSPMPEKTPPPAFPTRPPPSPTPSAETPRVPERPGSTPPFPPETPVFPTPMVPERTPGTPPIPERPTPMVPSTPEFPRTPTVPERTLSPSMPPFETPKTPQPPQTTSPFVPPETPRTPTIPERTPGFPTPMMSSTPRFPETPPMPEKTPPPEVPMHPPSFPTQPPPVQTSPTPKIPPITASRPPETPPVPVSSTAPPPTMVPNRVRGKAHVICEEEGIQFRVTTLFPFTGQIFAHDRKRVPSCVHTFSKATPVNITFPYNECGIRNAGNQSAQTQFHMQIIVVFEQPDGSSTIQSFISQCLHQKVQYQKQEIPKRIEEALEELHLIPTKLEQKAPIPECRMRIVKEMEHGHEGDGEEVGNSVDLGQPLRIEWSLVPESDAYGFHVRNCTVKDLVSSVEHTVIDERGCSTDLNIFAHPHYDTYHDVARVHWHAFKVPDNSQLSIRCSFQICSDIADSNNGLTSCDSIPSPPFCPDLITSPSNSILFDINGNLVEKRSAFHGAPGDLHQHVHASICFAAPDDGFCDSQQFELQRQNHLRAVIASERYCVSRVWLTIVSGTSLWTTLISVGVNFYCRFAHRRRALSSNPVAAHMGTS
ncbi:hypothetical protein QR680_009457 [Steinernema hermaphroditum]|uniref:ZP domain-containing protein n=1 Tax=Steinernema hermaphroditum TaxID=289476 RepID=A0AA39ILQ3_9BILA|nr:hypothetical protein QR680_009457 [Steinernema hermaphroditum]